MALGMNTCSDQPATWDNYVRFYVGDTPKFLQWAIASKYYYNVGSLLASLAAGNNRWIPLGSLPPAPLKFHPTAPLTLTRKLRLSQFITATNKMGVILAEHIPFHSAVAFKYSNAANAALAPYHASVLDTFEECLTARGWLVAVGLKSGESLKEVLKTKGTLQMVNVASCTQKTTKQGQTPRYHFEMGCWVSRKTGITHTVTCIPFWSTIYGPNSRAEFDQWLTYL